MIYKNIKNYEGFYQISDTGIIRSIDKMVPRKNGKTQSDFRVKGKVMKVKLAGGNRRGEYFALNLYKNKKSETKYIHRLVAETFLENPLNKKEVNHKDGIKTNNNVSNLEWCTKSENMLHSFKMGLSPRKTRLNLKKAIRIRKLRKKGLKIHEIASLYGVSKSFVSSIIHNRRWPELPLSAKVKETKLEE